MLAIAIHDLLFKWPGAAAFSLAVPELQIACGEKVFLLGASGSGKSTLVQDVLAPALLRHFGKSTETPGAHSRLLSCVGARKSREVFATDR